MTTKKKSIFPLLIYQTLSEHWSVLSFWLMPLGVALWWAVGHNTLLDSRYRGAAFGISMIGGILTGYCWLLRRAALRCYKTHFTLHAPLYPLAFSYRRVKLIRPVEFFAIFPPQQEKRARWRLYQKIWGKTAVVIDLKGYPVSSWWLKLWFSRYLFYPQETALVLLVDDWMGLTRELEIRRAALLNR
ncbi:MAG: hypothetical protein U9Q70_10480 [Chloroflexota bacterium]|nr:hypothetical protein [Chloroflexota bacterium]